MKPGNMHNLNPVKLACAIIFLATIVASDDHKTSIGDLWGTEDVLDVGVRPYNEERKSACFRSKNEGACKECCIKRGCQNYSFKRRFSEILKRGTRAIHNECTCFKVLSNSLL